MPANTPTFTSNSIWLLKEFGKIFHSPVGVAGGLLDAFRGWKFSRSWMSIWLNLPAAMVLLFSYGVFFFSQFSRSDGQVQRFLVESESRCSTSTLEDACNRIHEPEFSKAYGTEPESVDNKKAISVSEMTLRYAELLSKRILAIETGNQSSRYRLALIHFLNGKTDEAEDSLQELADGRYGEYPQANAWVARKLFIQSISDKSVIPKLVENLDKGGGWKDMDYRLLLIHARYLESVQDYQKAIVVARKATSMNVEANIDLARLYAKVKDEDGLRLCAVTIEDTYIPRLDTPRERDSDRLAIAQVRRLTNRFNLAIEVLNDGLRNKTGRPLLRRELSEIHRQMYLNSIVKDDNNVYTLDASHLEKAVEADPDNPALSADIAKMIPMGISPSEKLQAALGYQLKKGITTSEAYMLLAEGYYKKKAYGQAVLSWRKALEKDPNNILAMNNLALQLAKDSPDDLSKSFELIGKAVSLAPTNAEILDSYGDIFMVAKKYTDAINKFELAIRIDPTRMETRRKLIEANELAGIPDMAKSHANVLRSMEQAAQLEKLKAEKLKAEKEKEKTEKPKEN